MTISLYAASVPAFKQMLGAMDTVLGKAEQHGTARKIDPNALLHARLFPDMYPLTVQVQIACDFARGVSAQLAGVDVPKYDGKEQSFADLHALIGKTVAFIDGIKPSQIDGQEDRVVTIHVGRPNERKLAGQAYLLTFGLPQFYFHVTTFYAILRHSGVEIGKRDFMGRY